MQQTTKKYFLKIAIAVDVYKRQVTYSTDVFNKELTDVEDKFKELTGKDMPKFFRPPMGQYSEKSLAMTKDLGYKTVFWSFAYGDYEPSNQPSPYEGKKNILDHLHDGSILLLHAISKTCLLYTSLLVLSFDLYSPNFSYTFLFFC